MGRRGPGTGLRQARTAGEATEWRRLFDALSCPEAEPWLPHLGLRTSDAEPLRAVCAPVSHRLRTVLAETRGAGKLAEANAVLASAYAGIERQLGARVARAVFGAADDGFPTAAEHALAAGWSAALLRLRNGGFAAVGLTAAKRDTVTALLGHYLAGLEPTASAPGRRSADAVDWLAGLTRWRRFASACRALAKVLTPAERQRFVAHASGPLPPRRTRMDPCAWHPMRPMPSTALSLPTPCTVGDFVDEAERAIAASKAVELWKPWVARSDAEELVGIVLRREIGQDDLDIRLTDAQCRRLEELARRRVAGEPMTLIRGHIDFRGVRIELRPGVFSPRLSSELMAREAVRRLARRASPVAVEVACGVGPVALSIAHSLQAAEVWGLDISDEAVQLGRHNARRLGLRNIQFAAGDLLAPLPQRLRDHVDLVSMHPPYVGRRLLRTLPVEIARYEPAQSLTDNSDDGLGLVRRVAEESPLWLRRGGWLMIEVSPDLARSVSAILRRNGYADVVSIKDSPAVTRVVAGRSTA